MVIYYGLADRASDGSWGMHFPDLPGCNSSGETLTELQDIAKEAIALWMESVREDGLPIPGPRTLAELVDDKEVKDTIAAIGGTYWLPVLAPEDH